MQLGLSITEPNTGDFLIKLKQNRSRTTEVISDDLRGQIESSETALEVEFVGILSDLIGDLASSPAPIEIKIFSNDKNALHAKAEEIEASIKNVDGVVDTDSGVIVSGPAITFKINMQNAARFGVSLATNSRNAAARARHRRGFGTASAARHCRYWRIDIFSGAFARRYADGLCAFAKSKARHGIEIIRVRPAICNNRGIKNRRQRMKDFVLIIDLFSVRLKQI